MRGLAGVLVVLLASTAFAAPTVGWWDISDFGGVSAGDTVFPSLLDDPATLLFNNSAPASGLTFSTTPFPTGNAWVNFPLQNSNVTIHTLSNIYKPAPNGIDVALAPDKFTIGDTPNLYYTNTKGDPNDPMANAYFPYNIPRPQADCSQIYSSFYFNLAHPATEFGVYLPLGSNNWGDPAGPYDDYNNNFVVSRLLDVFVLGPNDTFTTASFSTVLITAGYCPFLTVNDPTGNIKGVVVIDDQNNTGATVGFMDPYAVFAPQPHPGDANNDGAVDVIDLGILAKNYDATGATWAMGDFNGDGVVDVIDLGILAKNYDWTGAPAGAVPEPLTLGLLGVGAAALIRRRR